MSSRQIFGQNVFNCPLRATGHADIIFRYFMTPNNIRRKEQNYEDRQYKTACFNLKIMNKVITNLVRKC